MISAFGVDHGYISKARKYTRDKSGRFARTAGATKQKHFTDEEYELEAEAAFVDQKNLVRAEGDDKTWKIWRKELEEQADYLDQLGEGQLADDIWITIIDSEERHQHLMKTGTRKGGTSMGIAHRGSPGVTEHKWNPGVSKAYGQLAPKLTGVELNDRAARKHDTMENKLRMHSVRTRNLAGSHGAYSRSVGHQKGFLTDKTNLRAKEQKKAAHGMYTAVSRLNRAKRVLP